MTIALIAIAFFTSATTAVFGLGGGMLLIACMPGFLPAPAIIPVHAVVQLASNLSRAGFAWHAVHWRFTAAFALGAIAGGTFAAQLVERINLNYAPLLIAGLILYNVWGPRRTPRVGHRGEFMLVGAVQTGLGMLAGATGPLGAANLYRRGLGRDAQVATNALFMTVTHGVKIALFAVIGFAFGPYLPLAAGMVVASVLGALAGTRLRGAVPPVRFNAILKWLLTALALRMVLIVFAG